MVRKINKEVIFLLQLSWLARLPIYFLKLDWLVRFGCIKITGNVQWKSNQETFWCDLGELTLQFEGAKAPQLLARKKNQQLL